MRISLLRISLLRFFKTITKIWLMRFYGLFILLLTHTHIPHPHPHILPHPPWGAAYRPGDYAKSVGTV